MFNAWIIFLMASSTYGMMMISNVQCLDHFLDGLPYTWEDVFPDLAWVTDWQIEMQWRRPPLHKLILFFLFFVLDIVISIVFIVVNTPPSVIIGILLWKLWLVIFQNLEISKKNPRKFSNHRGATTKIKGIATSLPVSFEIFILSSEMSKAPGI